MQAVHSGHLHQEKIVTSSVLLPFLIETKCAAICVLGYILWAHHVAMWVNDVTWVHKEMWPCRYIM